MKQYFDLLKMYNKKWYFLVAKLFKDVSIFQTKCLMDALTTPKTLDSGVGHLLPVINFGLSHLSLSLFTVKYEIRQKHTQKYWKYLEITHNNIFMNAHLIPMSCLLCWLDQRDLKLSLLLTKGTCSVRGTIKEWEAGRLRTDFIGTSKWLKSRLFTSW